jgi:hypothetical protein
MKKVIFLLVMFFFSVSVYSQKLISKNSHIWFYSHTPMEDIEAHNRQAVSVLDPASGDLAFNLLIKSFEFKIALMQEHFNENYMESDKFPKSSFKGKILNNSGVDYNKDGTYPVDVSGELTIHNVTKTVAAKGLIEVKKGMVTASAAFNLTASDYGISIPNLVENKIAKDIKVTVEAAYTGN